MANRKPSPAEDWFVEDAIASLEGLCGRCRRAFEAELAVFDERGVGPALREVYRQSRSIRVSNAMNGKPWYDDNWDALKVCRALRCMIGAAESALREQKPHLFLSSK